MIARVVGVTPDLEDLVQMTFAEALASLARFRGDSALGGWIGGIATHVALHYLRDRKFRRHLSLDLLSESERPGFSSPFIDHRCDLDRTLDGHRLRSRLRCLLDKLGSLKRTALLLQVQEEFSIEEISALMKTLPATTRTRAHFARREMRALIAADPALADWAAGLLRAKVHAHRDDRAC